ncbi:unnamed protein product [marine sediment metagenome]|uniref:DUF1640 domain-containing protein n=1 Tax=marine sediment metagenome TaxID=412755 RepID=X0XM29_9ZZZZ
MEKNNGQRLKAAEWQGYVKRALEDIGKTQTEIKNEAKNYREETQQEAKSIHTRITALQKSVTSRITKLQLKVACIGATVSIIITLVILLIKDKM